MTIAATGARIATSGARRPVSRASGEPHPTEGEAREAANKELSPFVVEIPASEATGGGYTRFPAGPARFGERAEVPRGPRVVSV